MLPFLEIARLRVRGAGLKQRLQTQHSTRMMRHDMMWYDMIDGLEGKRPPSHVSLPLPTSPLLSLGRWSLADTSTVLWALAKHF